MQEVKYVGTKNQGNIHIGNKGYNSIRKQYPIYLDSGHAI